ncbi:MAG: DUF4349 domain-containing protein [Faecalibacterium sp.]
MKWYEYKMEVDDLHASEDLKARLLAMQPQANPSPAPKITAAPARKKGRKINFPTRRVLGVAACFAAGVICCNVFVSMNSLASPLGIEKYSDSSSSYTLQSRAGTFANAPAAASYSLDSIETSNGLPAGGAILTQETAAEVNGRASESSADHAKIIYRASISLESKDYDTARIALSDALSSANGYLESSDESTSADSDRSLSMTLRIPQENYKSFLDAAAQAGNLVSRSEQAEDVTTQYMDVEARLANLTAQRTRLQELRTQAGTLEDLLKIESSLSDVQYQIESWQSQLDWYARQVACCTVDVFLYEVREYTPADNSFGARFLSAFGRGWSSFIDGLQGIAVWLALAWPVLLLAAALATAFLLWHRRKHSKG